VDELCVPHVAGVCRGRLGFGLRRAEEGWRWDDTTPGRSDCLVSSWGGVRKWVVGCMSLHCSGTIASRRWWWSGVHTLSDVQSKTTQVCISIQMEGGWGVHVGSILAEKECGLVGRVGMLWEISTRSD
jgi:hypothetical protein